MTPETSNCTMGRCGIISIKQRHFDESRRHFFQLPRGSLLYLPGSYLIRRGVRRNASTIRIYLLNM